MIFILDIHCKFSDEVWCLMVKNLKLADLFNFSIVSKGFTTYQDYKKDFLTQWKFQNIFFLLMMAILIFYILKCWLWVKKFIKSSRILLWRIFMFLELLISYSKKWCLICCLLVFIALHFFAREDRQQPVNMINAPGSLLMTIILAQKLTRPSHLLLIILEILRFHI